MFAGEITLSRVLRRLMIVYSWGIFVQRKAFEKFITSVQACKSS